MPYILFSLLITISIAVYSSYILFNNISLLIINITLPSIAASILTGIVLALLGYLLLHKIKIWTDSVTFVVSKILTKGNTFSLILISTIAAVGEEFYARGFILVFYNTHGLNLDLILIIIFANFLWTLNHIFNAKEHFRKGMNQTIKKSTPHLVVVFLIGIPLTILTLIFNSITPPIIAHFSFDLLFGLLYRHYIKSNP
ncbi:Abortive infection protein [Desulfofarcimen acetoxidans DSM 771]|uniref:Abortive infection protein n=1 Tax=Desulfofarcimen acetoxidans (strain ATCC 49208 / DSM 771 / KCTC 5769 / VKM B-1644 / 5575) TaxID=485916 RepID=C8W0P5_DESAS|nr:CPBP family glutamic-type intramembrane protease [Desulfofarcimen acetoxidans]ACV63300.1 Abortive infection protein [Desulfofarcimen acetoxidans DSM 771]